MLLKYILIFTLLPLICSCVNNINTYNVYYGNNWIKTYVNVSNITVFKRAFNVKDIYSQLLNPRVEINANYIVSNNKFSIIKCQHKDNAYYYVYDSFNNLIEKFKLIVKNLNFIAPNINNNNIVKQNITFICEYGWRGTTILQFRPYYTTKIYKIPYTINNLNYYDDNYYDDNYYYHHNYLPFNNYNLVELYTGRTILTLYNITNNNSGTYMCKVRYNKKHVYKKKKYLSVLGTIIDLYSGTNYTIKCNKQFLYRYNDIQNLTDLNVIRVRKRDYTLFNVSINDNGYYNCIHENIIYINVII